MTLKEKLRYEIGDNCEHSSYCRKKSCQTENGIFCFVDKQTIENCEQIADEFAIGFAEWSLKNYDGSKSVKELLEIYKQEKDYAKCAYCNLENGNHKLSCPVIKITMIL